MDLQLKKKSANTERRNKYHTKTLIKSLLFNCTQGLNFLENINKNLITKYRTFYKTEYTDHKHKHEFKFSFDVNFIAKRQEKISKLIHFKKIDKNIRTKIKGFEAPFKIVADFRIIGIGYDAGFGNDNSAGMGCVEPI